MPASKNPHHVQLPDDAAPLDVLHGNLCHSRLARPSIESLLTDAGKLYAGPGGQKLCGKRDYLDALSAFCQRAGISIAALDADKPIQQHRAKQQHDLVDAPAERSRKARQGGLT